MAVPTRLLKVFMCLAVGCSQGTPRREDSSKNRLCYTETSVSGSSITHGVHMFEKFSTTGSKFEPSADPFEQNNPQLLFQCRNLAA